jgi:glycosyltransferase involved in cell wall biosynthesis
MSDLEILYSFPLRLGVPGIGMIGWHQAAGFIRLGMRVTVVCGSCERPLPGARRIVQSMKLGRLPIPYGLFGPMYGFLRHDRVAAECLRELYGDVDVVHCWPLGSLATLRAARDLGIPSFLERPNCHTRFAYEMVEAECRRLGLNLPNGHSHRPNAARLTREEAEYAQADRLACPSEFVARTFAERGFASDRLVVHQYGYDPDVFHVVSPNATTTESETLPFVALFVGSCEPRKGLHYALDAWLQSGVADRGEFWICGEFVPGYRDVLAERLEHPSVRMLGRSPRVQELMRRADVLVLSSIEEGSALVTYEARACGCVLLVSDATGARCTHMVDGLLHHAGDVAELSRHLALVATDPALLGRLRENSLGGAGSLTWLEAARHMRDAYRRTVARRAELTPQASRKDQTLRRGELAAGTLANERS